MCRRRVVITGLGAVSPYGLGVQKLLLGLAEGRSSLRKLPEKLRLAQGGQVAGLVGLVNEKEVPREKRRTMSPMSLYAYFAAKEALSFAQISPPYSELGVSISSTLGSPQALEDFFTTYIATKALDSIRATTFFKVMGHTVAANLVQSLGLRGRQIASSQACASGLMSLGLAYEAIALGAEEQLLCGGADEYHPLTTATFAKIGAASTSSDPKTASRPFDQDRNGVVCGEGAGLLLLESQTSAEKRGATILAEIKSFAATSTPESIVHPDKASMQACMQKALSYAKLKPKDLSYVNAHATSTKLGDLAEAKAIAAIFQNQVPVSSLKGHLGHTMAASGALETIVCVAMFAQKTIYPTLNLENIDPDCGQLWHVRKKLNYQPGPILKNCFALGGGSTSLIIAPPLT
ncbi:MAG: beta-ketoacyl-[Desulfovibrio sp.]|nr:beta-ketoacyl-[acyl-carrier-protein] synthase family protein [Desulfovibrio sp.]